MSGQTPNVNHTHKHNSRFNMSPNQSRRGSAASSFSSSGGQSRRGSSAGYQGRRGSASGSSRGAHSPVDRRDDRPVIYLQDVAPAQPRHQVSGLENDLAQSNPSILQNNLPARQGYGSTGRSITLRTNYFELSRLTEGQQIMVYDISGLEAVSKRKRQHFVRLLLENTRFHGIPCATDYSSMIVTPRPLDLGEAGHWQLQLVLPPDTSTGSRSAEVQSQTELPGFIMAARARNTATVRVTLRKTLSLEEMGNYLRHPRASAFYAAEDDTIQALNIAVCRMPSNTSTVAKVGQNKFYPFQGNLADMMPLGDGLLAFRGYFASVRPSIGRLLLNLNVANGAFYQPGPLMDLMRAFGNSLPDPNSLKRIGELFRGLRVEVRYASNSTNPPVVRQKTIRAFPQPPSPIDVENILFDLPSRSNPDESVKISVFDYFRRHRGITLQNPKWPAVNVGTLQDPQYIPVELCYVLPGQPYNHLLSPAQTSNMIRFAVRQPHQNAISIAGNRENPGTALRLFGLRDPAAGNLQQGTVNLFGVGINTEMTTVHGRILDNPRVAYRDSIFQAPSGSWNCHSQRFEVPGTIGTWKVIAFRTPGNDFLPPIQDLRILFNSLEQSIRTYGIRLGRRLETHFVNLNVNNRTESDRHIGDAFRAAYRESCQLVFVVLPEGNKWLYSRIKTYGDLEYGMHTICAIGNKLAKDRNQGMFFGNLALKFAIKGGGVTHSVDRHPLKAAPLDDNTMLMGIDVTHPTTESPDAPSIASVVASIDCHLTQYPGSVRTQTSRQEMVDGLTEMVSERLKLWPKKNRRLPGKIVLYRDGVGHGQYKLVAEQELPSFYEAFKRLYAYGQWPKLTVLIVGKRHHTRFYPTRVQDADGRTGNPQAGTVVDRGITMRSLWEFYLQSHSAIQGTARPAHYVVIRDEIGFTADQLEHFTNRLCYSYNRATKAVSVPPPAYYADLLCTRGRLYLFNTFNGDSADRSQDPAWTGGVHPRLAESTWYV